MHRTFIAACAASLISVGMPVLAQSTTPAAGQSSTTTAKSSDKDMTITGCLEKNKSGGFWLSEAESGSPSSSTTTAGTSGSAATTTGGSATTTGDKDMHRAMANHLWNLENGHDLDKYVNQKIQVTGHAKKDTSGDELKGTKGHEMQARDFDVKSVTVIASSCR
jgi:hypothetical protein